MKIKFHETVYNILGTINVIPTHFQATFEKGENTFDFIATDTLNTNEITVYNDEGETEGIYTGYSTRIALYLLGGNSTLSVEFENANIQAQIDALVGSVSSLDAGMTELAEEVVALNETQESQDAAIEELAEAIVS